MEMIDKICLTVMIVSSVLWWFSRVFAGLAYMKYLASHKTDDDYKFLTKMGTSSSMFFLVVFVVNIFVWIWNT